MIRPVAANGRIETGGAFTPVLRSRVVERIASAATQRIVLIIAPAGYGKSVALGQYLEREADPYVRYDVRAEHSNLLGFIRGFSEALLDVAPDARRTVSGAYEKSRTSKTPGVDLAMWMHAHVKTFTGVLAIDDLHVAENDPEISRFLVSLIERTKGRARFVIASRSTLDLPVGSWLAYGEMDLTIDEQDLQFNIDEARQAAKASRVGVRDEELSEILSMTEGWPTALSFALRTSTRSVDLRNIAATTREMVYRYLAEQVYQSLEDDERDLLHFASYLPEIDLNVLRAAGYERAKALVESIRDRVAFIYPDRPNVYRCHDLFRDFLQHQLELEGDITVTAMRERVGSALEVAGNSSGALISYASARSTNNILRLLEKSGFDLVEQAHGDSVQTAIDALPQGVGATHAVVLGLRGLNAADAGQFDRSETLLQRAIQNSSNSDLSAKLALGLSLILINQDRDVTNLLEPLKAHDISSALRGEINSLLAVSYANGHQAVEAHRAIALAEKYILETESDRERAKILHRIATASSRLELPIEKTFHAQSRAAALASEEGMLGLASRAFGSLASIALLYEDDMTRSVWYAQQASNMASKAGDRFALQSALLQLISLESKRGNLDRLKGLEIQFTSTATTDAKRMAYVIPARAMMVAWEGRFNQAQRLMSAVGDTKFFDFDEAHNSALQALYCVSDEDRNRALGFVERSLEQSDLAKTTFLHGRRTVEIARALCAITESLAGRTSRANRILQKRPETGGPSVEAIRAVASSIIRAARTPGLKEGIRETLDGLQSVGYGGLSRIIELALERCFEVPSEMVDLTLTKAECGVLKSLSEGRSPKDIALESGRSIYTVQAHIQNVIRKMGCRGRNEALVIARKQGLLA